VFAEKHAAVMFEHALARSVPGDLGKVDVDDRVLF
jgi:hypothetical protein